MPPSENTIAIHYARALTDSARRQGLDPTLILSPAGLSEEVLERRDLRMSAEQFSALLLAFWRVTDDEFLGMSQHPSRHGSFTLMAKQAVHQQDLRKVYRHICRFYSLVSEDFRFALEETPEEARVTFSLHDPRTDPDHMLIEFFLLLWHRFPSWLTGASIRLSRLDLDFAEPAHVAEYKLIYPCATRFNAGRNALVFSPQELERPVVQSMETLRNHLDHAPLTWVNKQRLFPRYSGRVRRVLEAAPGSGIKAVCAQLGTSERTLRRRLADEETTFQAIRDQTRRNLAIRLLCQDAVPVSVISERLGFADPAAFSRAFRKWTGQPPLHYRRQLMPDEMRRTTG
ncbi:AraC family transcriptional regulator [Granulosicoccaceae sp. 1_MG-2023]|nr:AraC family transcriptional regulator [Granulosicoccaceae sp. 1_MG-2023]